MKPAFGALVMLFVSFSNMVSALSYSITDFRHPDGKINFASSINELGQVAGICTYNKMNYLYLWDDQNGFVFIENQDVKKGYSYLHGGPPFLNDEGNVSMSPLTNKGGKYFIDDANRLCKITVGEIERSLNWSKHYKLRVNNSGQILGNAIIGGKIVAIIYNENDCSITNVYKECKYNLYAANINDNGWVVAYYADSSSPCPQQGILWTPEFGVLYLGSFMPTAINNHGTIVGKQQNRGVLWEKGKLIDLSNELKISKDPTTTLLWISEISDINDRGQMIGLGQTNEQTPIPNQAFLLTPRE